MSRLHLAIISLSLVFAPVASAQITPVPELIIAGIGYPVSSFSETSIPRWMDYTPSADATADSLRAAQLGSRASGGKLRSGGGPQFVGILRDEIIPFIEAGFRTTRDRGLFGDSFGGLLAAYILVTTPELFSRYALSSPSLWWKMATSSLVKRLTPEPILRSMPACFSLWVPMKKKTGWLQR